MQTNETGSPLQGTEICENRNCPNQIGDKSFEDKETEKVFCCWDCLYDERQLELPLD